MDPKRRRQALLAVLVVVLAGTVYLRWPRTSPVVTPRSSAERAGQAGPSGASSPTAPDVRLEALEQAPPTPGDTGRNLFRFRPRPVQAAAPEPSTAPPPRIAPPGPPPPSVPPIPLKFIGILASGADNTIAVLSDGRGAPVYGKEGETVLGQYKILRIGAESIEMSYLDGRGRQTIRLSGS